MALTEHIFALHDFALIFHETHQNTGLKKNALGHLGTHNYLYSTDDNIYLKQYNSVLQYKEIFGKRRMCRMLMQAGHLEQHCLSLN